MWPVCAAAILASIPLVARMRSSAGEHASA
jgi:hypothetical protein